MKPLLLLLTVFVVAAGISRIVAGDWHWMTSGNIAMCAMLCFTALGHFKFPRGMAMMIPARLPYKRALVFITGVAECLLGIGLLIVPVRETAGIILVFMLVVMLPANIYAAIHHINYETAAYDGKGPGYLWIRVPMQVLFIGWVLFFSGVSQVWGII